MEALGLAVVAGAFVAIAVAIYVAHLALGLGPIPAAVTW